MRSTNSELNIKNKIKGDQSSILEAVLNTVIDGIITINKQGEIQTFNPSAERIFGYTPEDVIGKNVKMLMPEPYHSEHDNYLHNYMSTGDKQIIGKGREVTAQRKNGDIFPMELGVNQMNIEGETMFVGTIRDISDRKYAQLALTENQAKLEAIVENTVDGLITINEKGQIEHFNKACELIFGFSSQEVIGQNVKVLMPEPYKKEHDGYLTNYHTSHVKKIIGIGREVEGQRKDGSVFPLDLSVSEVNIKGRTLYSGIVRDISERKIAEKALKQANSELEEFSYRTSHDLRSPLVSSLSLLNFIRDAVNQGQKESALMGIDMVEKSLTQLEMLVKDILLLTQTKNEEEALQHVDLEHTLRETCTKLSHMDNFKRLNIEFCLDYKGLVFAKKSRFVLVIENLISNAIKYQDINKPSSFIKISSSIKNNQLILELEDNGLGIPQNQQEKIFEMFKRFHPKIAYGSGLGLYMIKKSIDILGGNILYNNTGDGSLFKLTIPME
jgi:PAS domain S-box-containing protein